MPSTGQKAAAAGLPTYLGTGGQQIPYSMLVSHGDDGNPWPTDDLFVLFRNASISMRATASDGHGGYVYDGTISGATDQQIKDAMTLADTGGTRGQGTAYGFMGTGSPTVQAVVASWNHFQMTLSMAKHALDPVPLPVTPRGNTKPSARGK
jgi:hypothetical protein